jgi:hypothetical protein
MMQRCIKRFRKEEEEQRHQWFTLCHSVKRRKEGEEAPTNFIPKANAREEGEETQVGVHCAIPREENRKKDKRGTVMQHNTTSQKEREESPGGLALGHAQRKTMRGEGRKDPGGFTLCHTQTQTTRGERVHCVMPPETWKRLGTQDEGRRRRRRLK